MAECPRWPNLARETTVSGTNRDGERRASILRLTLDGLEADLDDLRDELLRDLESYESRLREASESLPEWLAVDPAAIRALFQLPSDGDRPAGILGPRTVAMAAASVEQFIDDWFAEPADDLDHEGVARYDESLRSALAHIDAHETFARHTSRDAQETLGEWLDGILLELEDTRERDEAALKQLIAEGAVGKGRDARAEIAGLWEDQRNRAADVRKQWAQIEELTFSGLESTMDGLSELRQMIERADEGMRGAYPGLATPSDAEDVADDPEVDEPGGGTLAGLQHDSEADAAETDRRETVELDREPVDQASNTFLRVAPSEVSEVSEVSEADEDADEEPDEVPVDESDEEPSDEAAVDELETAEMEREPEHDIDDVGDTLIDDVGETVPVDMSEDDAEVDESHDEPVESGSSDDSPADEDPDAVAEPSPHETETVEMERESEPEADPDEDPSESETQDAVEDSDTDSEPEDEDEPLSPRMESARPESDAVEPVVAEGFRIVERWVRVPGWETLLVLAPPIVSLAALVYMMSQARSGVGTDPIRDTPWGILLFVGAAIWLLLVPAVARWRFRVDGLRARIVRNADVVEDAEVCVDGREIRIGRTNLDLSEWQWQTHRWESTPDGTFGWAARVHLDDREVVLVAAERNFTEWDRSNLEIIEIPSDVWQVEPRVIRAVEALDQSK